MKLNTAPNAACSTDPVATKKPFSVKTSVRAGIAGRVGGGRGNGSSNLSTPLTGA